MNIIKAIKNRRSIRKYKDTPIEKEKLISCLEAARISPSACNSQPWHFVVLDNPEIKNKFADTVFTGLYANMTFVKTAPIIVAVVSDKGNFKTKLGNFLKDTSFYLIDIGIAIEHFILQAQELGLGTCWIGWFNDKKARKFLKLPKGKKVDMLIAVGYSDERVFARPRKKLEEMSSFNKFE